MSFVVQHLEQWVNIFKYITDVLMLKQESDKQMVKWSFGLLPDKHSSQEQLQR